MPASISSRLWGGGQRAIDDPKTFKTERGCPFLIKRKKKESTYNNKKKKRKKEKITCNNPEERKKEKEYQR